MANENGKPLTIPQNHKASTLKLPPRQRAERPQTLTPPPSLPSHHQFKNQDWRFYVRSSFKPIKSAQKKNPKPAKYVANSALPQGAIIKPNPSSNTEFGHKKAFYSSGGLLQRSISQPNGDLQLRHSAVSRCNFISVPSSSFSTQNAAVPVIANKRSGSAFSPYNSLTRPKKALDIGHVVMDAIYVNTMTDSVYENSPLNNNLVTSEMTDAKSQLSPEKHETRLKNRNTQESVKCEKECMKSHPALLTVHGTVTDTGQDYRNSNIEENKLLENKQKVVMLQSGDLVASKERVMTQTTCRDKSGVTIDNFTSIVDDSHVGVTSLGQGSQGSNDQPAGLHIKTVLTNSAGTTKQGHQNSTGSDQPSGTDQKKAAVQTMPSDTKVNTAKCNNTTQGDASQGNMVRNKCSEQLDKSLQSGGNNNNLSGQSSLKSSSCVETDLSITRNSNRENVTQSRSSKSLYRSNTGTGKYEFTMKTDEVNKKYIFGSKIKENLYKRSNSDSGEYLKQPVNMKNVNGPVDVSKSVSDIEKKVIPAYRGSKSDTSVVCSKTGGYLNVLKAVQ